MLRNYFLVAYRTLLRYKGYTLLNVLGLTLGIACSILIFQVIKFQTSFDRYHANADRIVQVTTESKNENGVSHSSGVPAPVAKALRNDFAFLERVSVLMAVGNRLITIPDSKGSVQKKFKEEKTIGFVEPDYFHILDYQWLAGSPKELTAPNTVVLTQKMAEKYFGTQQAVGKVIRLDNTMDLKVTGILADIPENTDRRLEVFVSWASMPKQWDGIQVDNWGWTNSGTNCLVLFKNEADIERLNKLMPAFRQKYLGEEAKEGSYPLVRLKRLHFDSNYGGAKDTMFYVLAAIGLFLLLTACINFVNLATAQALKRSKEVGVRKVIGGTKAQLFGQFLTETGLITLVAIVVAVGLSEVLIPLVNAAIKNQTSINFTGTFSFFQEPLLWAFLLGLLLVVTLLAGFYPGMILSGFQPVAALKGKINTQQVGGLSVRRSLVIVQFIITQVLIISTIVITQQMGFYRNQDIGYDPSAIIVIPNPTPEQTNLQTFRHRLTQVPGVEAVSFFAAPPTSTTNFSTNHRFGSHTEDEPWSLVIKPADYTYANTFGLKLLAGRNIIESDTAREYLVNEAYVKKLGLKIQDVLGQNLDVWGVSAPIVGVIKDFNNLSLREEISPIAIFSARDFQKFGAVRVSTRDLPGTLAGVENVWNDTYPNHLYEQSFMDERIAKMYKSESLMLQIIRVFSFIAIFIGCLGLYGLVSFLAAQKTKEIGVRKVLGASLIQILGLFGKEFARLILVAFAIAAPLGWWLMSQWLEEYTYRISIGWETFALAILLTTAIAALTVGWQSFRAALANPAKSLKSE
ncbi:ABC transporter permease [Siphonobacter sp.]|uniref:ABC transporter permease n=1 Tax=Siphonobacter sp. TaxID=1869184 RepID=UPI003B3B99D4